jgi:tetratricopeptide (TPR) repeat protein
MRRNLEFSETTPHRIRRSILRFGLLSSFTLLLILVPVAARGEAGDRIVVMPFENRSQLGEYNWIRESFSIHLGGIVDIPGFYVLSPGERDLAFERLRLNPSDLLTRASMIRVAEAGGANLALIGEYDIGGEKAEATISIRARMIETNEGRLVANRVFNFSGPLDKLQQIQGQLAWSVIYLRDPAVAYTKEQFIDRSTTAPPGAYQSYIKAVQTLDRKLRESYLRRAVQEYENSGETGHYGAAIYELGLLTFREANDAEAVRLFRQLDRSDPQYELGLFYLGLAGYRMGDYEQASTALTELSVARPLPEVLNNLGIAKLAKGSVGEALPLLQRAVANRPEDPVYRFNYGYGLWRAGQMAEAVSHLRTMIEQSPRDGEALFLLAKSLGVAGETTESARIENEAKRYLPGFAKWTVDPAAIPVLGRLKHDYDPAAEPATPVGQVVDAALTMAEGLTRVRRLIAQNDYAAAGAELGNLRQMDGENGEILYLRAVIDQQRGDTDSALSLLQAAVARDPGLFDAHLLLGRLYLARNDRVRAMAHANRAAAIDPASREAAALRKQIEIGR